MTLKTFLKPVFPIEGNRPIKMEIDGDVCSYFNDVPVGKVYISQLTHCFKFSGLHPTTKTLRLLFYKDIWNTPPWVIPETCDIEIDNLEIEA